MILKKRMVVTVSMALATFGAGIAYFFFSGHKNDKLFEPYRDEYNKFNTAYIQERKKELDKQLLEGEISSATYHDRVLLLENGYSEYYYLKNYVGSEEADKYEANVRRGDCVLESSAVLAVGGVILSLIANMDDPKDDKKEKTETREKQ